MAGDEQHALFAAETDQSGERLATPGRVVVRHAGNRRVADEPDHRGRRAVRVLAIAKNFRGRCGDRQGHLEFRFRHQRHAAGSRPRLTGRARTIRQAHHRRRHEFRLCAERDHGKTDRELWHRRPHRSPRQSEPKRSRSVRFADQPRRDL